MIRALPPRPPVNDVAASPGGHLWDLSQKNGLTYRNYGCFYTQGVSNGTEVVIPDNYPDSPGVQPGGHDLQGISDVDFRRFDLDFPDSDGPSQLAGQTGNPEFLWATHTYGKTELPSRIAEWNREFNLMLAKDPTGKGVPALMTLRLGTDHTLGASAGRPTRAAWWPTMTTRWANWWRPSAAARSGNPA